MEKWILWWILLVVVVKGEDDLQSSDTDGRCDHNATFTIKNLIRLVEKIEQNSQKKFGVTMNALRDRAYPGDNFDALCGGDAEKIDFGLSESEEKQWDLMTKHPDPKSNGREKGVVVTTDGTPIAFGHVLTGMCTGYRRNLQYQQIAIITAAFKMGKGYGKGGEALVLGAKYSLFFQALDNLHAGTLAGDLGQTCAMNNCEIGPAGNWDNKTCPMEYHLTGNTTEATYAEILGDIHGFILGILVPQINPTKLSSYLESFYLSDDGLGSSKFRADKSIVLFKEVVAFERLVNETDAFNEVYAKRPGKFIRQNREKIEHTVRSFFELDFMKSCVHFPDTHKITYFISLVEALERQSRLGLKELLKALYEDREDGERRENGFEWYIVSDIMTGRLDRSTKIYSGVFEDNLGRTLKIGDILLAVYEALNAWFPSIGINRLIVNLLPFYKPGVQINVSQSGKWDVSGCPKQHHLDEIKGLPKASFYAFIDSVVLAYSMEQYVEDNPSPKLSKLLNEYYGLGLNKQLSVKSGLRFTNFNRLYKEKRGKQQTGPSASGNSECYPTLKDDLNTACKKVTEEVDIPLKQEDCDSATQNLCNAITQAVAQELKGNVQCKYGDIMKLKPKGKYSNKVRSVKASHDDIKAHMSRANKYKHCFEKAGQATGVQPALIAAIASRESLVYSTAVLDETGYSRTPGNNGYGMMQCDPAAKINCTKYGPDSCEHVQQLVEEVLVKDIMRVKKKLPKWTEEQHLQGAVAAYNFGSDDVETWGGLDIGSTDNDYSGDVIARAQYLICTEGWKYCNEVCPQAKGSLPAQSTLQKHYPSPVQLPDSQLQDGTTSSAADALRVCHMLNSIPGHSIDHRVTGSKVAENGMVYYDESRKVRLYLDDRYSFAKQFSSVSEINGTAGVLFVQYPGTNNGIIGLWNGKKVLYIDDFTTVGNTFFLWSTATDCKLLAETGDCEFYMKCVEARLQCGEEGYPQAYGYKFCNKFSEFYELFTDKGKQWVDKVRACLMTKLYPVLGHPGLTCKKLTEVAFMSHVKCYVQKDKKDPNDVSFCDVMVTPKNWHALYSVYNSDKSAFYGPHWKLAWGQILQTLNWCRGKTEQDQFIDDAIENGIKKVHDIFSSTTWDEEDNAECSAYANAGNCKFYECFESRFRCKRVHGFSYLLQFELPSCLEFKRKGENFNAAGRSWLTKYQKCLMGKLLPLYLSEEVNCIGMGYLLKQHRATCMLEAGFCDVINDNEWFIELATKEYGYPLIEPRRSFTLPIAGTPDSTDNSYYRELDLLQRDIAYARKSCLPGPDPDVCVKRYSPVTKLNMKMKNPDYF